MTDANFLTQLDLNSTHGDSRRTASDQPRLLFFTECDLRQFHNNATEVLNVNVER